jgi:hypothetical protein
MTAFRVKMLKEINKKKKFEKIIDMRNPKIPDEFLK